MFNQDGFLASHPKHHARQAQIVRVAVSGRGLVVCQELIINPAVALHENRNVPNSAEATPSRLPCSDKAKAAELGLAKPWAAI